MEKLYFAKFLPVEGTVGKDDWFLDGSVYFKAFAYNFKDSEGNQVLNIPNEPMENFTKVELFICSKEINEGDEVLDPETGDKFKIKSWEKHANEHYLKIIGKLSPDAIWVRNGDEFNEEELQMIVKHRSFPDMDMVFDTVSNYEDFFRKNPSLAQEGKYTAYVAVLNSTCQHFH